MGLVATGAPKSAMLVSRRWDLDLILGGFSSLKTKNGAKSKKSVSPRLDWFSCQPILQKSRVHDVKTAHFLWDSALNRF